MKCAALLRNRLADAAGGNSVAALPLLNAGLLEIWAGPVPADADAVPGGGTTLLGTLTLNASDAFGASSDDGTRAEVTAGAITGDNSADATGTATFARLRLSDGTQYGQLTVGATSSGAELELSTTSIIATGPITVSSLKLRALEG